MFNLTFLCYCVLCIFSKFYISHSDIPKEGFSFRWIYVNLVRSSSLYLSVLFEASRPPVNHFERASLLTSSSKLNDNNIIYVIFHSLRCMNVNGARSVCVPRQNCVAVYFLSTEWPDGWLVLLCHFVAHFASYLFCVFSPYLDNFLHNISSIYQKSYRRVLKKTFIFVSNLYANQSVHFYSNENNEIPILL